MAGMKAIRHISVSLVRILHECPGILLIWPVCVLSLRAARDAQETRDARV